MKGPTLQNKRVGVLRMAYRIRKVLGTFEERAPGSVCQRKPKRDVRRTGGKAYKSRAAQMISKLFEYSPNFASGLNTPLNP